ncbi:MAG: CopD family protein [Pseudomonadales bacterium]|nr:CopD family protein [Pseudomonadales bacterium]
MLWVKAFHIIFVVCWFAGIFYLPRLFVNHAMTGNQDTKKQLALMEYKLYRFISPFAWLSIGFGIWLSYLNWDFYKTEAWFHLKVFLVLLLVAYHMICGYFVRAFQKDLNTKSHIFFRWFNEFPVLILFAVIILVVVRPI